MHLVWGRRLTGRRLSPLWAGGGQAGHVLSPRARHPVGDPGSALGGRRADRTGVHRPRRDHLRAMWARGGRRASAPPPPPGRGQGRRRLLLRWPFARMGEGGRSLAV